MTLPIPPLSLGRVSLHRWQSRRHFYRDPDEFFLNFLECEHTFSSRGRFAGSRCNSGFYFGSSYDVITAEQLFYEPKGLRATDAEHLRRGMLQRSTHLEVTAHIEGILDLTSARQIKEVLTRTHEVHGDLDALHDLTFFEMILSTDEGGSAITDVIGYFAFDWGYAGVRFPSVRILTENHRRAGALRRFWHSDLRGISTGDTLGEAYLIQQQLAADWNLVLFGGSQVTRLIQECSYVDETAVVRTAKNPYFHVSPAELQARRLRRAAQNGLPVEEAIRLGLADDMEIMAAYQPLLYPRFTLEVGRHGSQRRARWWRRWRSLLGLWRRGR